MKTSFLIAVLSLANLFIAKGQSAVEQEIKKLNRESQNIEQALKLHESLKPDSSSEDYQSAVNTLANSRDKLMNNPEENAAAVESLREEINRLERKKEEARRWEQEKQELEQRKQDIGRNILVMSKLLDVESSGMETRKVVEEAEKKYRKNIDKNVAVFSAFYVSINTMAKDKASGYSLK